MAGFAVDGTGQKVVFSDNVDFSGATIPQGQFTSDGQLLIGSTVAPHIRIGSLTAGTGISITNSSGNVTITNTSPAGPPAITTITGNLGMVTPSVSGNVNLVNSNTTVQIVGSSQTLTQNFGLSNLLIGTNLAGGSTGIFNVGLGANNMGASITNGSSNTAVGNGSLTNITSGSANSFLGISSGGSITTGSNNIGVGNATNAHVTTGNGNVAIGPNALQTLTTGSRNVVIGSGANGGNYTTSESDNILIGNQGVNAESNVIRIGTQGSGANQQSQCFLAGVLNTTSGQTVNITTPGGYPYTTLTTDYVILVDSSVARTITPLASPATGTTYRIKDNVGSAAANHITITPSGKNIDGAASFVISTNFGSADITYNGTQWNVL